VFPALVLQQRLGMGTELLEEEALQFVFTSHAPVIVCAVVPVGQVALQV
jgi:predicted component of type VI protein secretion system